MSQVTMPLEPIAQAPTYELSRNQNSDRGGSVLSALAGDLSPISISNACW